MKLYGVIGNPISHSLSPHMHNHWYSHYGLNHHYHAFHVKKDDLPETLQAFKTLDIQGFNITIPHKVAVLPYLDELDDEARMLGAVNTVVNKDGKLIGYNTDGLGFQRSLLDKIPAEHPISKVLIIGGGGAARAIGLTLAKHTSEQVDYTNRTFSKAESISLETRKYKPSSALSKNDAEQQLGNYSLIINCTPMGMNPKEDPVPLELKEINSGTVCADIIYKPLFTPWLEQAKKKRCRIINGLPMLIYQGALAFEHWLGFFPVTAGVEAKLSKILEGSSC